MRIVFMGTPEFATESLMQLYNDGHDIAGVFTQADKPRNRGMKKSFSPVKELALSYGTPVYQPDTLKDGCAVEIIRDLKCDLIAVVAYGKFLPGDLLNIPPLGCVNIHGSLLPKYRGAAPVQHVILNGECETGVTSQYISEIMDAGDILLVKKTTINDDETSVDLMKRLSLMGAELLGETVRLISDGCVKRKQQNHAEATYAPLLTKEMSPIDWTKTARSIKNKVRALQPWPIATTTLNGIPLKIFSVDITENTTKKQPGSIISTGKQGIEIACNNGSIIIKELQAPNSKKMSSSDYLKGNPLT